MLFYEVDYSPAEPGRKQTSNLAVLNPAESRRLLVKATVVLAIEGDGDRVDKAFELIKSIKGEPLVTLPDTFFVSSAADYNYDALAQLATLKGV